MELPRLIPTNFEEGNDRPYAITEPETFSDDGRRLTPEEAVEDILAYAKRFENRGYKFFFGKGRQYSPAELIDSQAQIVTGDAEDDENRAPHALNDVLTSVAVAAKDVGFDENKARMVVSIGFVEDGWNPNEILHSDGTRGQIDHDTKSFKVARFVYALGQGSLIYPDLAVDKYDAPMIRGNRGEFYFEERTGANPLRELDAPSKYDATEEELLDASAQQVLPGRLLAFDPTRTFWHQAPKDARPILVVDVDEEELHA